MKQFRLHQDLDSHNDPMDVPRIVHLTSVHSPFDVRIFVKECRSLARAGFHVTIIAPHTRDERVDGVHIKSVPMKASDGRLTRMTRTTWNVLRRAIDLDADLYHFHDPELIPVGLWLRWKGKKVIYDIHEDVPKDVVLKEYLPRWTRPPLASLIALLEEIAAKRFSALITVSPLIAERFYPHNGRTVLVFNYPELPSGTESNSVPWQSRHPVIVFPGGILPERGIREMVYAMACLPHQFPATLEIASHYFPQDILEELQRHPGWRRVRLLGSLSRSQVQQRMAQAMAGIVTYLPDGQNLGAMPHKLFEFMASGIPVIASDFPLWRKLLEDVGCAVFVNPRHPDAIARAIEFIITHPADAEAMGERGKNAVCRVFNWNSQARELVNLYNGLTGAACVA